MGLDCYVNVFTTDSEGIEHVDEIWYGRKENEIHGWMQRHTNIAPEDFNCKSLPLTKELIDEFEQDLKDGKLTPTPGLFFGDANHAEDVAEAANELIKATRTALDDGEVPYYYSWW